MREAGLEEKTPETTALLRSLSRLHFQAAWSSTRELNPDPIGLFGDLFIGHESGLGETGSMTTGASLREDLLNLREGDEDRVPFPVFFCPLLLILAELILQFFSRFLLP